MSGGQGEGESISEAQAMGRYLIDERQSTMTQENLRYSKALIDEAKTVEHPRVLIVTSDYHMFRATWIAQSVPIRSVGLPSPSPLFVRINYMVREYFAVVQWGLENTFSFGNAPF